MAGSHCLTFGNLQRLNVMLQLRLILCWIANLPLQELILLEIANKSIIYLRSS